MRRHVVTIGRALALGALALMDVVLFGLALLTAALTALGLIFVFTPVVRLIRRRTMLARRLAGRWLGAEIAPSYLPPPPPPRRQPDGWYRYERQLYKTPRWPEWNNRWKWMFTDPATWRDGLWLSLNPLAGGVLLLPLAAVGYGLAMPWYWTPAAAPLGVAVAVAGVAATPWLLRCYTWWTRLLLSPTAKSMLAGRVQRLDQVRLEAADSQAAELRRIERDLHDGAQARLVAMGMTLGAVEELVDKDPVAAKALLAKVRDASSVALTELRDLVRGIHPPVLAERGLGDAVRALALDSPLQVTVTVAMKSRPESPVESAAYFSISELLTNAARHGGADRVWIDISDRGRALRVTVTDDGSGGADPSRGSGLRGIERRLAAFDGVLALSSPAGGPTTATLDLPNASGWDAPPDKPSLPRRKAVLVALGWGLGWLPLFPQGLVAMIVKLAGEEKFSWFYALYLPGPWQWPAIVLNILLGLALYGMALAIPIAHSRRQWMAEVMTARLWLGK
ncbi:MULTISPECIES: sensor histidine kinase [Streptosporangium]|uniref:histidine kinase n=1 Tax=Streptosporangium brasiliense TaxID=47480 RepID=A0ABT9R492_9ACTN|nr:histidine kinase [Streptosporangium brasiliense]MDP9864058.1 signal transduction histidine kinase [Streptosporangium brasiliense]